MYPDLALSSPSRPFLGTAQSPWFLSFSRSLKMRDLYFLAAIVACFGHLTGAAQEAVARAIDNVVTTVTVTRMHTSTVLITTS